MVYTLRFFSLQNAVCFIILTYLVPVLFTFYIQGVLKLENNSGAKRLDLTLQNRASRVIEQLILFHDHALIIIITIITTVFYTIIRIVQNKQPDDSS